DEILCAGDSALLQTKDAYTGYEWSTGAGDASIYVREAGTYTVTATTEIGCKTTGSIDITSYPESILTVSTETGDTEISIGKTLQLLADETFVDYLWEPATGLSDPAIFNPVASPRQTTTYTLTVSDENGCIITESITLS